MPGDDGPCQLENLTFLFADVERSSEAWLTRSLEMTRCIPTINGIVERAGTDREGVVFAREGDGRAVYFEDPVCALDAAIAAQVGLASDPTGTGGLRVRIGLHSGTVYQLSDGDLGGTPLNYSGRLHSVAHGGQIIVSTTTREMLGSRAGRFHWRDLGSYALRDFEPQTLWQLDYHHHLSEAGHESAVFPPLRTKRRFEAPPPSTIPLIGRSEELSVLGKFKSGQVITVTGPGGIGKTSLIRGFIERHGHRFSDGVCFVDLVGVSDPEQVADAVASALGVDPQLAVTREQSISDALAGSDALVVLDNCEDVTDGASPIAEALVRADGPTVVATSRVPLGLVGEIIFPLGPLGVDNSGGRSVGDSEQLFGAAALLAWPGFDSGSSESVVTQICERLGGMPLAIELAATRMSVLKPRDLLDLLDDDLTVLEEGSTTVQSALRWSVQSVDSESQRVGAVLSHAQPDATLTDLASMANRSSSELLSSLRQLVANGLVQLSDGRGQSRYRMLQPLRRPVAQLLDDQQHHEIRARQADTYAALALDIGEQVQSSDELAVVKQLTTEFGNIRSAVQFDIERSNTNRAASVAAALHMYGFLRMNYELYSWTETLLRIDGQIAELGGPGLGRSGSSTTDSGNSRRAHGDDGGGEGCLDAETRAILVGVSAFRAFNQGDMATAMHLATTADELSVGDGHITSRVVLMAGHGMAGDFDRANSELNRGLRWCDANHQPFYRTNLHVIASMGLTTQGLFDEAAGLARHGLQLAEKVANPSMVSWSLTALADARRVHSPAQASALLVSALEIARSVSNQWVVGQALLNLSRSYRSGGELSQSAQVCVDALGHAQQQANRIQSRQAIREAFLLLYELGEFEHARHVMAPLQKPSDTLPPSPDQQRAVEDAIGDLTSNTAVDSITAESALSSIGHRSTASERNALVYARATLASLLSQLS